MNESSPTEPFPFHINSCVTEPGATPQCLITWDGLEVYASVDDIRATANDLLTAAAYADMAAAFLKIGMDKDTSAQLLSVALGAGMERSFLGSKNTFTVTPAASSKRKAGAVIIKRGSRYGELDTDHARDLAGWFHACAEGSEHDCLVRGALTDIGFDIDRIDMFFQVLSATRPNNTFTPPNPQLPG